MRKERSARREREANLEKIWEVALSPFAAGAELAMCQCCSRRTAEKDGGDDEDAAGSAGKRKQLEHPKGGGTQKGKTGLRRRERQEL